MKHFYAQSFTLLLLLCIKLIVSEKTCSDDDLYVIRSIGPNGLVLDGTNDTQIVVQHYTGFSTQLWRFKTGSRPGLYYIINNHTGHVLDFLQLKYPELVTNVQRDSLEQQWMVNKNGIIVNAAKLWNIDISGANYVAGNKVGIWENNGCECQKYVFQKKV